jgi:hypothetical protein
MQCVVLLACVDEDNDEFSQHLQRMYDFIVSFPLHCGLLLVCSSYSSILTETLGQILMILLCHRALLSLQVMIHETEQT